MIGASFVETWRTKNGHEFRVYVKSNARYFTEGLKTTYPKLRAEGSVRILRVMVYKPSNEPEEE